MQTRPIPTIERDLAEDTHAAAMARQPTLDHASLANELGALVSGVVGVAIWITKHGDFRRAHIRHLYAHQWALEAADTARRIARGSTCRGCDARLSADDGPYCLPCLHPDVFPDGPDWDDLEDGEAD